MKKMKVVDKVVLISVYDILPNRNQPRKNFNISELTMLADSIKQNGILQPLTVTKSQASGKYELVAGERRLRAAKMAFLTTVPCIVLKADANRSAVLALIENIQRQNLSCFEEAFALQRLMREFGLSQQEVAKKIGKAQSTVANKLRLLRFDREQMDQMEQNGLTERHARAIVRIEDAVRRQKALDTVIRRKLNVAQTDQLVESILKNKGPAAHPVFIVKDIRLFLNTINKAVNTMKRAGIEAQAEKKEMGEYIEYTVKIPIQKQREVLLCVADTA